MAERSRRMPMKTVQPQTTPTVSAGSVDVILWAELPVKFFMALTYRESPQRSTELWQPGLAALRGGLGALPRGGALQLKGLPHASFAAAHSLLPLRSHQPDCRTD